ncbi:outer membrane beta-barrel family protein [Ichthyobacterium seriolicida]|uniref:TonB-dependent receptor n=2 Tax=Ichthyobacterium seriolicida TaxID=242600 RepID=A0A1J1DWI1_9FLAO|nr:outer membrane beta-barrel family protein [Ichthyobacterium seriolicida]BAV94225.1 TonB-dependent receptor [Ichthyobacterium seriolicida]
MSDNTSLSTIKKIFLSLLVSMITITSYSQYKINGIIQDNDKLPLEYTEVILQTLDSVAIKSKLTDKKGYFIIDDINKGEYELIIRYFSENIHNQIISVERDLDLKTIYVNPDVSLKEIVLEAKNPVIEKKPDRLILNVDNSVAATGRNALEVLKITPRLKVENDKISMIGKEGMSVMINGRIVQFSGEELSNYLMTLNSEDLKKIEVIPNPPAKYSAEGNSGLINIVTKKSIIDQWNASLNGSYLQRISPSGRGGASFNFKKGDLEITSSIGYSYDVVVRGENSQINYTESIWKTKNKRERTMNFIYPRLGLEYKINDKLSTGFNYNFFFAKLFIDENNNSTAGYNTPSPIDHETIAKSDLKIGQNTLNYHIIYDIDTIGRKLSLDFDLLDYNLKLERNLGIKRFIPSKESKKKVLNKHDKDKNYGAQDVDNYSVNLDMEHPTEFANYNYGGRVVFTETNSPNEYYDIINGEKKLNANSNEFNYKENNQAIYFSAQKNISEEFQVKLGMRYEFTQTKGYSKTLDKTHKTNYSKLFPTVYLSYNLHNNHTFSINYGKRIERPAYWHLNPFIWETTKNVYVRGNQYLRPSFTDNVELEYTYKGISITTLSYSYTDDGFGQIGKTDNSTNKIENIHLNFYKKKNFGINQTLIYNLTGWWNLNATANVYYQYTDSKVELLPKNLNGLNSYFKLSNNFILTSDRTLSANLNFVYVPAGIYELKNIDSYNSLNLSLRWLLLDNNLTLSLNANDIFNSSIINSVSIYDGIESSYEIYRDNQFIMVGVSYRFGDIFTSSRARSKNTEEQKRISM